MATAAITAFDRTRISIVPGYDIIPESPIYPVRIQDADGSLRLRGKQGEIHHVFFTIVSTWEEHLKDLLTTQAFTQILTDTLTKHLLPIYSLESLRTTRVLVVPPTPSTETVEDTLKEPCL